jgi:hypothetical protein
LLSLLTSLLNNVGGGANLNQQFPSRLAGTRYCGAIPMN